MPLLNVLSILRERPRTFRGCQRNPDKRKALEFCIERVKQMLCTLILRVFLRLAFLAGMAKDILL